MSALGDMLRAARESRGWSLNEAGEIIGCAKAHLHALEVGQAPNPTLNLLARFVIVYGLRPEALIATAIVNGDSK